MKKNQLLNSNHIKYEIKRNMECWLKDAVIKTVIPARKCEASIDIESYKYSGSMEPKKCQIILYIVHSCTMPPP